MDKYLMSEEELVQCIKDWTIQGYVPAYFIKNNFLKSKTPVEVIAEGKILACPWLKYDIGDIRIDVRFRKRKNKINKILRDLKNKKVQIIIREVKQ